VWVVLFAGGCLVEYTVGGAVDDDECPAGQEKCHGDCVAAGSCDTCPEGQVVCDGACVAADTCGCESGCDDDREVCAGGACVCRTGLERCGGVCVDSRVDAAHCGECDEACAGELPCEAGACVAGCTAPRVLCGRSCVELESDSLHCGECGEACESDEVCVAGECRDYTACAACPCACDEGACCESPFLGGAACVKDGCA